MMRSSVIGLALVGAALAQNLTINTPAALIECEPASLTFSGGTAPYFVSVLPGGEVSAAPLLQFGQVESSPITWTVNITSGTSVTLELRDSTGTLAYDSPVTIQAGTSTSCISDSTSASASASASSSSSASASASSSSSASSASATTSSSKTTTTTSATTTSASGEISASSASASASSVSASAASATASKSSGSTSGAGSLVAPLTVVMGLFAFLA